MGNQCKIPFVEDSHSTLNIYQKDSPKKSKIYKKIEELKKTIMQISIFERDKIAEEKYQILKKNYNPDNILEMNEENLNKYFEIIELLLMNNTNKAIVKFYLKFLKTNKEFINYYELNNYDEEIEKYQKLFSVKEIEELEDENEQNCKKNYKKSSKENFEQKNKQNNKQKLKESNEKENLINFLEKMTKTKKKT